MRKCTLIAVLTVAAIAMLGFWYYPSIETSQDTGVYKSISENVKSARVSTATEIRSQYPPLASSLFFVVSANPWQLPFAGAWLLTILLAIAGTVFYSSKFLEESDVYALPLAMLATVLLLGQEVTFARFDIFIALLLFLAWRSHARGRFADSGIFLMIAASLKGVPLFLLPLFFALTPRKQWKQWFGGLLVGGFGSALVATLILGWNGLVSNVLYFLQYQSSRGFQAESSWSGVDMLLQTLRGGKATLSVYDLAYHNADLGGLWQVTALAFLAGGLLLIPFLAWKRRKRHPQPGTDTFVPALLLWILAASPILSPQFFVWVMPLLIAWVITLLLRPAAKSGYALQLLFLSLDIGVITQWIYPYHYSQFLSADSPSLLVLHVLRTLAMLWLMRVLVRGDRPAAPVPRPTIVRSAPRAPRLQGGIIATGLLLCAGIACWSGGNLTGKATYRYAGKPPVQAEMPVMVPSQGTQLDITFPLTLAPLHPTIFHIKPDDCITMFQIDGRTVNPSLINFCDYGNGRNIDLQSSLSSGTHSIHVLLSDTGGKGGLVMTPSYRDPLFLTLLLTAVVLSAWGLWLIVRLQRQKKSKWRVPTVFWIFLSGCVLRVVYMLATPYNVRGHDTEAHLDYIKYVSSHWHIPPAVEGWEFHQPPLYYFLGGIINRVDSLLGRGVNAVIIDLRLLSLFLSLVTLGIAVWIGSLLFPAPKDKNRRLLFAAAAAAFPSLVYLSSTVTNDVLFQCLAIAAVGVLLHWWRDGGMKWWYLLIVLLALALVTKMTALVFVPLAFGCLLFKRELPWKRKIIHGLLSLLLFSLLTGWLPAVRFLEKNPSRTLSFGNEGMSSQLLVPTNASSFLVFDPFSVLTVPYNNPWDDSHRRQYFWEYFFKSAFFGEFGFPDVLFPMAGTILLLALPLLVLALAGFVHDLWTRLRDSLPMTGLSVLLLLSSLVYRLQFPYAPNQDFRFVTLLILPAAFFAIRGIDLLPQSLRAFARFCFIALCALCSVFLLLTALNG